MQRNDEVPTHETKVTFSLGTSERFWESDHISWDVVQKLCRCIQVPLEVSESDAFAGDQWTFLRKWSLVSSETMIYIQVP